MTGPGRRWRWPALAAGVVVVAVAAVLIVTTGGSGDSATSPRGHALRACAAAERFEAAVKRNDDIDEVRGHLDKARVEAGKAEQGDSLYVGLASGMEALNIAIANDDPQAARVGIDVVRTECGYVKKG